MPTAKANAPLPLGKRLLRGIVRLGGTLAVLGLAAVAVMMISGAIAQRAASAPTPEAAPVLPVKSQVLTRQSHYSVDRRFPGQVEAARSADLSFEEGGTIDAIDVDEGAMVAAGAPIARLDTRLMEAERKQLAAARRALGAEAELARRTTERREQLKGSGFASAQALDEASLGLDRITARIAEIDAGLARLDVRLEKAVIRAPFSGRIATRHVDEGVIVAGGHPVLSLLEGTAPRFRVGIDPALADQLTATERLTVTVDGKDHAAVLGALRADLDPVSRTRTALLTLPEAGPVYGQTGQLTLTQRIAEPGFVIPVAALREGVRGLWTVLTLAQAEDGLYEVGVEAVEIIHADEKAAYVRGTLQDGARIISGGTHRVTPGQMVRVVPATGDVAAGTAAEAVPD